MRKITLFLVCGTAILFYPIACVITGVYMSILAVHNEIMEERLGK